MHRTTDIVDELAGWLRDPAGWSDARFDAAALALYELQRARVPAYDSWCRHELAARPDPQVRSWQQVPALPIEAFRRLEVHDAAAAEVATFRSSGTTSSARSVHRLASLEHYDASLDAGVAAALLPDVVAGMMPPLACVQLQPSRLEAPESSLSHMFDRIRLGPWCADSGSWVDARWQVDAGAAWHALSDHAAAGRPVLVLATSFALALLLEHARAEGWPPLQLPDRSRVVDTGGYKGRTRELSRTELLEQVALQLGVPATWCENEYGMSELASQAWLGTVATAAGHPLQRGDAGARWTPPWLRVRVVDPVTLAEVADGEQGLLVFHDLANVWSAAAIRSEDLGVRRGRGFELVGRAPGAMQKGCSLQLDDLVR